MKLIDYMYHVLNQVDIRDDFAIQRAKERAYAAYQACRIQYHRPDRLLDILHDHEELIPELDPQESEFIEFERYVLGVLNKALLLSGDSLVRNIATAFLEYAILDTFLTFEKKKGHRWVMHHPEHAKEFVIKQLFKVDPNLKKMTLEDFVDGYDVSITTFKKNAFLGYGDEEEEYYSEEMDTIIAKLQQKHHSTDRHLDHYPTDLTTDESDEIGDSTNELDDQVAQYRNIAMQSMNGHNFGDFFPFRHKSRKLTFTSMIHDDEINETQIKEFLDRLQTTDFPGYDVEVKLCALNSEYYSFTIELTHRSDNSTS